MNEIVYTLTLLGVGGLIVYLGFNRKPQYDDTEKQLKRNKLEKEIKELEKVLKEEPKDLTPEQVEDYWNKK